MIAGRPEAAVRAEEFYRVLFEQARESVLLVDAESFAIVDINETGARRLGYERSELLGKPIREIHPEHDIARAEQAREEVLRSGGRVLTGLWHKRKDGTEFPVEISTNPATIAGRRYFVSVILDVTARHEYERRLRETLAELSEAKTLLETLQENASEGMCLTDAGGIVVNVNRRLTEIAGRPREEIIGRSFFDLGDPAHRERYARDNERLMRGEEVRTRAVERRPDGTSVVLDITSAPVEQGGRRYIFSIVRDVTAEVQAQSNLKLYREIIANTSEAIAILSPDGRYIEQNAAHERLLGYPIEELRERTPAIHLVEPDWGAIAGPLTKAGEFRGEIVARTRAGDRRTIELSAFAVHDEQGAPVCLVGIKRDITERKRAERQLRLLSVAVEQSPGIVLITDARSMIEYVNPKFTEVTGYAAEEILGTSAYDLGDQSPADRDRMMEQLTTAGEWRGEFHNRKKSGEFYWERASVAAIKDDRGAVYYVKMAEDITQLKQAEEELRRAAQETRRAYARLKRTQAQLVRSERLASAAMLLSGVAHEINNPIHVVLGNLKLLQERCRKVDAAMKSGRARELASVVRPVPAMLADALTAAEHARRVVEEFRAFARDPRAAEPADVNACVEGALDTLKRDLARVKVARRMGKLPPVRCVPAQIQHALVNVIKNAVEAMDGKGSLTVRTARRAGQVDISVRDTGRGIPRAHLRKVFEPFFTTKAEGRGLGLGLPISAAIVHNHGGEITLTSRPGAGTTVRLRLPLA